VQKKALLNRLMNHFYQLLSTFVSSEAVTQPQVSPEHEEAGDDSGVLVSARASEPALPQSSTTTTTSENRFNPNPSRIKRQRESGDGDDDHDRDREASQPPTDKAILPQTPAARLACPFFKNNQAKYQSRRTCPGPGWATVHRIKEHLYRSHTLPIRCPRCHEVFGTDREKDEHTARTQRCIEAVMSSVDDRSSEGIDATQEKLLRSRKRKHMRQLSEEEKWADMYLILFPDADPTGIPSPCKSRHQQ